MAVGMNRSSDFRSPEPRPLRISPPISYVLRSVLQEYRLAKARGEPVRGYIDVMERGGYAAEIGGE